jgi:hypothetical protein
LGARIGVRRTPICSPRKTSSNGPAYLPSRSRDQEAHALVGKEEAEVASLADPPSIGVAAATGDVDPASAMLDKNST